MCWQVHQLRDSGASQNTLAAVARRRAPLSADERGDLLGEEALPGALQMQVGLQSTLAPSSELKQREVLLGSQLLLAKPQLQGGPPLLPHVAVTCSCWITCCVAPCSHRWDAALVASRSDTAPGCLHGLQMHATT